MFATLRRPMAVPRAPALAYAELHCHSHFSFLDGASSPEDLAAEAARLGLSALAVTDHDGLYGVVRFAEAAFVAGVRTVFGAELTLGASRPSGGAADPDGPHLVVLARNPAGYARLSRAISVAHLGPGVLDARAVVDANTAPVAPSASTTAGHAARRREIHVDLATLADLGRDHWVVLTGCRKGSVPTALMSRGPAAAAVELARLVDAFGRPNVLVELWDHGDPLDSARNDALAALAARAGVGAVATNNVHYATPRARPLATTLAAVRARRPLAELDGWLPAGATAHLRSGAEQARRFARYPGVVERAAEVGRACAFDLQLVTPALPDFPVPAGHDQTSWLAELVRRGAERRYGLPGRAGTEPAYGQIASELAVIEQLGFAGYFLIVEDIVAFCREHDIYCQGRGSAANSAVCYALGITNADAVGLGLLFERFLSPERDGPPDIDLDIEHRRREEVIQYVYRRYGRDRAAQVANVITYRPRSAVRDIGKALGHPPAAVDGWARQIDGWHDAALPSDIDVPVPVAELVRQVAGFPRHLGIHSGGMVLCDRPVVEVCPVEMAAMEGRTVLQWDKDDCAAAGLVKFDLLGLGMLTALHLGVDLITASAGVAVDLATIPQEPEVYEMLTRADTVGVFQVESRAQMATLPRLKPRSFYDLVVEVALIRPGPIQGGSVHPYLRRRNATEPVTYLHPRLERSLSKTLGVPLFQEQLMQMAIDVAGFTPGEADRLRQAMGSKRSHQRMEALGDRLFEGMAANGITGEVAEAIYGKLAAFADFGFPESHSVSFAYLVYASAWMKLHYPAAFLAALLNSQPMGFYSPNTLVADARRHGVVVLGPDVNASAAAATLEPDPASAGGFATRLGIESVRNVGAELATRIAERRPFASMEDLVRRTGATRPAVEALATAGAFGAFDPPGAGRREALWVAGPVSRSSAFRLGGVVTSGRSPALPPMTAAEVVAADLWSTGVSAGRHPVSFARPQLDARGARRLAELFDLPGGRRVVVGGLVTHRQRPATAAGTVFVNLEDETGMLNVICPPAIWARHRSVARTATALVVSGRLERADGAVNLVAEHIEVLTLGATPAARNFR